MRTQAFKMGVNKPTSIPDPETNPWWWNPGRVGIGVTEAPPWFTKRLHELDPDLAVTWNRVVERYQVWVRKPSLRTKVCNGWQLLFQVKHSDGSYCPLDERTFAKLYDISGQRWGSGKKYFARVEQEMERDREKMERDRKDSIGYGAGEYFDYLQPKISMFGPSNGSKVANHG